MPALQASGGGPCPSSNNASVTGVATGELEGVLQDLGIEPMLCLRAGARDGLQGGVEEGTIRGGGLEEDDDQHDAENAVVPAGAAEALKRVQGMLEIALA